MEGILSKEQSLWAVMGLTLLVIALGFVMVVIAYGVDSIAPGVHDAYHDFRHVIGMPCH